MVSNATTLTISNVAPIATFGNGGPYVSGQTAQVSFTSQFDPASADITAGFRYSYDVNNDGTFDIGDGTYAGGTTSSSAPISKVPVGSQIVRGRILDKDGGASDYITTVVINKADTTVTLSSSTNPSVLGQEVVFTATIAGTPTGTVTFKDGGLDIGTCAAQSVTANVATCTISTLSVGTHPVTAAYNGDANFLASTSNTVSQAVGQAATTTTLTAAPNPSVFGQEVILTATIAVTTSEAGTPTGTVTFKDGGVNVGTCAAKAVAANVATCSLSTLTAGTHPVTAVYNGDTNFLASTSSTVSQVVNKANTTISVARVPSPSTYGQSVTNHRLSQRLQPVWNTRNTL